MGFRTGRSFVRPGSTGRALQSFVVVTAVLLAGCAGVAGPDEGRGANGADGRAPAAAAELDPDTAIQAPAWKVGNWFGHHVFLGNQDWFGYGETAGEPDPAGYHINGVVAKDSGDAYTMVTDDQEFARLHAVADIPFFGSVAKGNLTSMGLGTTWEMYEFPLQDKQTWTRVFHPPTFVSESRTPPVAVNFTVSYAARITTASGEEFPGLRVHGALADGTPVFDYDYVPAIGWYAHFWHWDHTTEDPDDYVFHAMNMGFGSNWTGTYYQEDVRELFLQVNRIVADPVTNRFDVNPEASVIVGYAYAYAWNGVTHVRILDPEGSSYERVAYSTANAFTGGSGAYDDGDPRFFSEFAAVPGTWSVAISGVGTPAVGGVLMYELVETQATL